MVKSDWLSVMLSETMENKLSWNMMIDYLNRESEMAALVFLSVKVMVVVSPLDSFSTTLSAKNVKLIQIIRPNEHPEVHYRLTWEKTEEGPFAVKVLVDDGTVTFSKMSLQMGAE